MNGLGPQRRRRGEVQRFLLSPLLTPEEFEAEIVGDFVCSSAVGLSV